MYFWKIDKLKDELVSGPLSQSEQFKYLLAESIVFGIAAVPFLSNNWFDVLNGALSVVVIALGTYYVYRCNGGENGERLLERYVSLSWVVFIRYFVLVLVPAFIAFYLIYYGLMEIPEGTRIPDVVFTLVLELIFYWLMGRHCRDVAKHAA